VAGKPKSAIKPRGGGRYPGTIRIIGGQWRSRRLPVLESEGLRPTPDRVRETLFNWLAPYIDGSRCLDLFAGTGALCLEALSRGASWVVMVERSPVAAQQLRENVARLQTLAADVVAQDALEYLAGTPQPFDIIFLDPPFADAERMIRRCSELLVAGWAKSGTLVYVEAPQQLKDLPWPEGWCLLKTRTAGQVGYHLAQLP
jgi:16S rRNA (guanine966-N2)-methyltransferase